MSEARIQSRIIKNLERSGWLVNKIIQSTKNGWPDLEAIRGGKTVYIEVKDIGEKPDPLQLVRHRQIKEHGGDVYLTSDKDFNLP